MKPSIIFIHNRVSETNENIAKVLDQIEKIMKCSIFVFPKMMSKVWMKLIV